MTTAGKRKAAKAGHSARSVAPATTVVSPAQIPSTQVATRSYPGTPVSLAHSSPVEPRTPLTSGGHAGGRKNLFRGLPSAPTLIGAAALALAAVGATVSQQGTQLASDDYKKFAAQASVLNSASSIGSSDALAGRRRAVSRDSQREALEDAASAELQSAAESQAQERNAALAALAASAEKHASQIAKNMWVFPLPAGAYRVSHSFGQCSYLWANCHTGEDFSAPTGTPILSIANGVVTESGYDGAYGNKTVVTLEDGTELWYCHQTAMLVSVGDTVRGGQQIGTVGSTGNSTGPHLHLEVRPGGGDPVDPIGALDVHGVSY
ncbi:MAG: M23 family metallopeptidase [Nocardioides sp.]